MHGVAKHRLTDAEIAANKSKVTKYTSLLNSYLANTTEQGNLAPNDAVLAVNPEFYTLWNIRRRLIMAELASGEKDIENKLKMELFFIERAIRYNPKTYAVWFHRRWVICQIESLTATLEEETNHKGLMETIYEKELELCSLLLRADSRNFHCWGYRAFIAKRAKLGLHQELDFSNKKIQEDFSNYSAWHRRSGLVRLLPPKGIRVWPSSSSEGETVDVDLDGELSFVQQAMFTLPEDESPWQYYLNIVDQLSVARQTCSTLTCAGDSLIRVTPRFSEMANYGFDKEDVLERVSYLGKACPFLVRRQLAVDVGNRVCHSNTLTDLSGHYVNGTTGFVVSGMPFRLLSAEVVGSVGGSGCKIKPLTPNALLTLDGTEPFDVTELFSCGFCVTWSEGNASYRDGKFDVRCCVSCGVDCQHSVVVTLTAPTPQQRMGYEELEPMYTIGGARAESCSFCAIFAKAIPMPSLHTRSLDLETWRDDHGIDIPVPLGTWIPWNCVLVDKDEGHVSNVWVYVSWAAGGTEDIYVVNGKVDPYGDGSDRSDFRIPVKYSPLDSNKATMVSFGRILSNQAFIIRQLSTVDILQALEPGSRWPLVADAHLSVCLGWEMSFARAMDVYRELADVDPLRRKMYKDEIARIHKGI